MKLYQKIKPLVKSVIAVQVGVYAANAAFFVLLSLFPAMMLLIGLLQYTPLTPTDLQNALSGFVPAALSPLLDYMTQELFVLNSIGILSFSAVFAVWSSSRGVYSLIRGINKVYHVQETRSYIVLRLRSALDTILLLLALIATLILHLFGQELCERLKNVGLFFLASIFHMNHIFIFIVLVCLFSLFYTRFPNQKQRLSHALPGAVATAFGWIVFSSLFTFYVSKIGNYSIYYGSLSIIALTMLWLYICLCMFFYGGMLNYYLSKKHTAS